MSSRLSYHGRPLSSASLRSSNVNRSSSPLPTGAPGRASPALSGHRNSTGTPHSPRRRSSTALCSRQTPYPQINSPSTSRGCDQQRLSLYHVSNQVQETPAADNNYDVDRASDVESDALNEVIMAIDMKQNGDLGCAYYIAAEEVLYLLDDVAMAGTDLVETLLLHAKPTTILLSSRGPEALAVCLERSSHGDNGGDGNQGAYILRNLNSVDFYFESAKEQLSKINIEQLNQQSMLYTSVVDYDDGLPQSHEQNSYQTRMLRLGSSINTESRLTIGCAGAILSDLQRRRSAQYLPGDPDALCAFNIRKLEMFSLFNSMFINADTIVALQIMQPEYHPNSHQRGIGGSSSGSKESLSIYGFFHRHARTKQGRSKLRQIFLRPSLDMELIQERQLAIALFSQPTHADDLGTLSKFLGKIANMKPCIALLRRGVDNQGRKVSVNNNVWATLQRFAMFTLQIRELLRGMLETSSHPIIAKVVDNIDPHQIHHVGEVITQTIDFEQSEERGRTAVKTGIDGDLDELKRSYDGMEHFLTEVIVSVRQQLPEWARGYIQNCSFLPQLGFLTVVVQDGESGRGCYDGEGSDQRWERMFVAEGGVYYKNQQMREMDAQFGDAYCMIIDREIEIVHALGVTILKSEETLIAASDVLGELDSLLALALGCNQHNWVRPQMTNENKMGIQGGRHPLQELVVPTFIANDCYLGGGSGEEEDSDGQDGYSRTSRTLSQDEHNDFPSTLILTGPNHSGKSVYLKQVALIVYLAHIGCYVPAERATIGITDRILTRVATRESVGRNESAFSIDLRQVSFAMNFSTHRSLILVDEFGKGTNNFDGVGLVTALLDHFTSLGPHRPKVLAATHFHEIFEGGFLDDYPNLALAHMDIHLDLDADSTEDQVTYLFKLVTGRSTSSFGSRCAAMNGVSETVVARAEELVLLQAQNEDLELACSTLSGQEQRKLERAEGLARRFLEVDLSLQETVKAKRKSGHYREILRRLIEELNVEVDEELSTEFN